MSRFMLRRLSTASALVLGAALFCSPAFGQEQQGDDAARAAERQQQMEQFRKRADDRMKELLKASDEEYAVLKPRIEKIQQTQRANDTRRTGFSMLAGNSSWRTRSADSGAGQRQTNTEGDANRQRQSPFGATLVTPVSERTKELQAALETKDVSNDALKTKLAELRAAKQEAKLEMDKLQEELRGVCTVRQESVLVMLGVLE